MEDFKNYTRITKGVKVLFYQIVSNQEGWVYSQKIIQSNPSVMDAIKSEWSPLRNLEKRIIKSRGIGRGG